MRENLSRDAKLIKLNDYFFDGNYNGNKYFQSNGADITLLKQRKNEITSVPYEFKEIGDDLYVYSDSLYMDKKRVCWDKGKLFLKEQNDEVVDFLYKLIFGN